MSIIWTEIASRRIYCRDNGVTTDVTDLRAWNGWRPYVIVGPKSAPNNPALAGCIASRKVMFGEFSRYAVYAVHTRFDAVCWFVTDAESVDAFGLPNVIRQESTFDAAITTVPR